MAVAGGPVARRLGCSAPRRATLRMLLGRASAAAPDMGHANEVMPRTTLYPLSGAKVHFNEMHPSSETVVTDGIRAVRVLLPVGYDSGTGYPLLRPTTGLPPARYPIEMESSHRVPTRADGRIARSCRKN